MSLKFRLKYINKTSKEEGLIDLMKLSSDYSQGESSFNTKIVYGSPFRGIRTGSGNIKHGKKIDFSIPIYETKERSLEEQIVFFTRLFSLSSDIIFSLERLYKNKWYSAEVAVASFGSYNAKTPTNIGSVKVGFLFIDNAFFAEDVIIKRIFENRVPGTHSVIYDNMDEQTDIAVPCSFVWKMQNTETDLLQASFASSGGYGITLETIVDENVCVTFDGKTLDVNGELSAANGIAPEVLPGKTKFYITSNFETVSFDIMYKQAVLL